MVKWKLDKNWFNLVVHVLGLNEVIIATKSGLGYVFLKTVDQLHFFREILYRKYNCILRRLTLVNRKGLPRLNSPPTLL